MTVHHHANAEIFTRLALAVLAKLRDGSQRRSLRCLTAGIGVALGIEHQNINVFGQTQHVVETTEANIIGPAVAANQPDRFFHQRVGIG